MKTNQFSEENLISPNNITARGNTVGFTKEGYTICAQKSNSKKLFKLWCLGGNDDRAFDIMLTNKTRTYFANCDQLIDAIHSLIDDEKTNQLKWW